MKKGKVSISHRKEGVRKKGEIQREFRSTMEKVGKYVINSKIE